MLEVTIQRESGRTGEFPTISGDSWCGDWKGRKKL